MNIYFDTSAIVKYFTQEVGSEAVIGFFGKYFYDNNVVFWTAIISGAESLAAFHAMSRGKVLTNTQLNIVTTNFKRDFQGFSLVEPTEFLLETAERIASSHKIKGCDAFQLASAIIAKADLIVSCDNELNKAAIKENYTVWNPMFDPIPTLTQH